MLENIKTRFNALSMAEKAAIIVAVVAILVLILLYARILIAVILVAALVVYFIIKRIGELQTGAQFETEQNTKGLYKFVDRFGKVHWGTQVMIKKWKEEEQQTKKGKEEEEMYERIEELEKEVGELKGEAENKEKGSTQ